MLSSVLGYTIMLFSLKFGFKKKIVVFYWNENDCASVIHMTNLYGIRLIL